MLDDSIIFADIDYRDHRRYTIGSSPWLYLVDDGDHESNYINKIRHREMLSIINESGFNIIDSIERKYDVPSNILREILPRYKPLEHEDISTLESRIIFTKRILG